MTNSNPNSADQRSLSREAAMRMLYAHSVGGQGDAQMAEDQEPIDDQTASEMLSGVLENLDTIDGFIVAQAKGWRLGRLARVDLSILRVAIFEMHFLNTPPAVAINEAVEMAKKYSGDKSPVFVNGVLAAWNRSRQG